MRHRMKALLLGFAVLATAGCGYHLRGTGAHTMVPNDLKTLTLNSYDPYGPLTRAVRGELRLNDMQIVKDSEAKSRKLPSLRINGASESQQTVSVFLDGTTAEYQLVLDVQATLLTPGKDLFPMDIRVFRSFFDNPLTALAKANEGDIIRQEMREQAAQQLVRRLLAVHAAEESANKNQDGKQAGDTLRKALAAQEVQ
ncbi:LPS assembly lipoprotein LptE [Acerihabitans sp. KWT182]|uniref:LPS-assembly lipoprotein LptE n=1 Tax=Acerihabitans sp. KWT182 TaxID=3157919 RepID=A0AAU7QF11_9GAMM